MRSGGGASIGLAVCLTACGTAWKPPPEPGPPPPPDPLIEWIPGQATIRCLAARFEVPAPLRGQVQKRGPKELVILPPASPPGGALTVRLMNPVEDYGATKFFQDLPDTLVKLHRLATGADAKQDSVKIEHLNWTRGRLVADYTVDGRDGKIVYVQSSGCRFAAVDYPRTDGAPVFTRALDQLDGDLGAELPLP
jgi:hypothetical protein